MAFHKKIIAFIGLDKGLLNVASGNAIATLTGALFWLLLASLLIPKNYGELHYLLSISFMFGTLTTLGLGSTVVTFISKGHEKILQQSSLIVVFSVLIASFVVYVFVDNFYVILLLIGTGFFIMTKSELLGRKNYKNFSLLVMGQRLVGVPLALLLYYVMGVDGIILGYAVSCVLFSFSFFKILLKAKFEFDFIKTKIPFALHSLSLLASTAIANTADKLLIGPVYGFEVLGHYQIGFQLLFGLSIIPMSLFQFLLPQDATNVPQKKLIIKSISIAIIIAIATYLLIPYFMPALFPNYAQGIGPAQVMVLGIIPMSINAILYSKFLGNEKSKIILTSASVRLSSLFVMILILGDLYGLVGLALSVLLSLLFETCTLISFLKIRPR